MFHSKNQRNRRDLVAVSSALYFLGLSLLSIITIAKFAGAAAAEAKDFGSISLSHRLGHSSGAPPIAGTGSSIASPVRNGFLRGGDNGAAFPSPLSSPGGPNPPRELVEDRIDDVGNDCLVIQHQQRDEVEFQCRSKPADDESVETSLEANDEVSFDVKIDPERGLVIKLGLEYEHSVSIMGTRGTEDGQDVVQEEENKKGSSTREYYYEIIFDRIIEYEKKRSQETIVAEDSSSLSSYYEEAYDWSTDEVVSELSLLEWSDISQVIVEREQDDGPAASSSTPSSTFSATTRDGILSFSFTVHQMTAIDTADLEKAAAAAATGSSTTAANKMEFVFEINRFPWTRNDTHVALISHIYTAQAVDIDCGQTTDGKEDEGNASGGDATTAEVNNPNDDMSEEETSSLSNKPEWVMFVSGSVDNDGTAGSATSTQESGVHVLSPFGEFTWAETAILHSLENEDNRDVDSGVVEEETSSVNKATTPSTSTTVEEDMRSKIVGVVATSGPLSSRTEGKGDADDESTIVVSGEPMMIERQTIAFSFVGSAAHSAEDLLWNLEAGVGYIIAAPIVLDDDAIGVKGGSESSLNGGVGSIWFIIISIFVMAGFYFVTMLSVSAKRGHHHR